MHAIARQLVQINERIVHVEDRLGLLIPACQIGQMAQVEDRLVHMENVQTIMEKHMDEIGKVQTLIEKTMEKHHAMMEQHHAMMGDRLQALEKDVMLKGGLITGHAAYDHAAKIHQGYQLAQREGYERIGNLMDAFLAEIKPIRDCINKVHDVCFAMGRDVQTIKPVLNYIKRRIAQVTSNVGSSLGHSNDSNDTNVGNVNWVNATLELVETFDLGNMETYADLEHASLVEYLEYLGERLGVLGVKYLEYLEYWRMQHGDLGNASLENKE